MAEPGESQPDETQAELAKQVRRLHAALRDSVCGEMVRLVHEEHPLVVRVWARLDPPVRAILTWIVKWCYRCKKEGGPHDAVVRQLQVRGLSDRFPMLSTYSGDESRSTRRVVKPALCSWDAFLGKRELVCAGLEHMLATLDTGRRVRADGGPEVSRVTKQQPAGAEPAETSPASHPRDRGFVPISKLRRDDLGLVHDLKLRRLCETFHVPMETRPKEKYKRWVHEAAFEAAVRKAKQLAEADQAAKEADADRRRRREDEKAGRNRLL